MWKDWPLIKFDIKPRTAFCMNCVCLYIPSVGISRHPMNKIVKFISRPPFWVIFVWCTVLLETEFFFMKTLHVKYHSWITIQDLTSLIPVKERDSRFSALRLPISEGISDRELLKLRSRLVRFGNSSCSFSSSILELSELNCNQQQVQKPHHSLSNVKLEKNPNYGNPLTMHLHYKRTLEYYSPIVLLWFFRRRLSNPFPTHVVFKIKSAEEFPYIHYNCKILLIMQYQYPLKHS